MDKIINALIEYKGGGFDGCFWEYNYCYIDSAGKFNDIYSSGVFAVKNIDELIKKMEKEPDEVTVYSLDNKEDLKDFQADCATVNIKLVLDWFNENTKEHPFYFICEICGYKCKDINICDSDKGRNGMFCDDCSCEHHCEYCGEVCTGDLQQAMSEDGSDFMMVCPECLEDAIDSLNGKH